MKLKLGNSGEMIAAIFLFAAAALLMCGVVAFGAQGYGVIRQNTQTDAETAAQYIATKVRSCDTEDGVEADVENGRICLHEYYGDDREYDYVTELYIYDGNLCELYHDAEIELEDSDGLPVIPADGMKIDAINGYFTVTVTSGGETRSVGFAPRCGLVGSYGTAVTR